MEELKDGRWKGEMLLSNDKKKKKKSLLTCGVFALHFE